MTHREAKELLVAHRPRRGERDERIEQAVEESRRNPELREWFRRQQSFHDAAEKSFRSIPVPAGLKEKLLREKKIVRLIWWREPMFWAAAAAVALLAIILGPQLKKSSGADFATYRSRMTRTVVRQYTMDVVTNDLSTIQRFLQQRQAPAKNLVPGSLAKLPVLGGGVLSWQGRPVSMVCLNGGKKQGTLFLFIAEASAVTRPPSTKPTYEQITSLMTVSWQQDGNVYVLAGNGDKESLRQLL